jgi:integrin beta 3
MFDGEAFGKQMVAIVKGHVDRATAPLIARIEELEKRELVQPEKGERGEPGEKGEPGTVDMGAVKALVDEALAAIDIPDPIPGPQGEPGEKGDAGEPGPAGPAGRDGRDGAPGRDGAKGLDGKDGSDGKDGESFTVDDLDVNQTDERTLEFRFAKGDTTYAFEFEFPVVIDRGVWKASEEYKRGDAVSWGGSLWIAQKDAPAKPDTADSGWRLAVKKGRDGKDAK